MVSTWLPLAREGSIEAINRLLERHVRKLRTLVRPRLDRRLRRYLDSGDIVQVTLLRAFRGLGGFSGSGSASFMRWLTQIARNEIRDQAKFYGRRKRDAALETPVEGKSCLAASDGPSAPTRLVLGERLQWLADSLKCMKREHRAVILLRDYGGFTFEEIGRRMNRNSDACRMLYARAMATLTNSLHDTRTGRDTEHLSSPKRRAPPSHALASQPRSSGENR